MGDNKVQGEGNYDAARVYDEQVRDHAADKERVKKEAEAAKKALEGDEGDALRAAEEEGKARAKE